MTLNKHWGWYPADPYYKSPFEIIHAITGVAMSRGHMLLNVGPDRYGRLNSNEIQILETVGNWMKVNKEAVKGVSPAELSGGSYGCAAKKGKYYYLYLHYASNEGFITIPECSKKFKSATLLGDESRVMTFEYKNNNVIIHNTPLPEYNTIPVIRLEAEEE